MKFAKEQRVTVPGTVAQGVVVDAIESITGFAIYAIRWLDEAGETHTGSCGEGDLSKANPTDGEIAAADAQAQEVAETIHLGIVKGVRRELDKARRQRKPTKRKR